MALPGRLFWLLFAAWSGLGLALGVLDLLYPGFAQAKLNMVPVTGATAFWTATLAGVVAGLVMGGFAAGIAFLLRPLPPGADLP